MLSERSAARVRFLPVPFDSAGLDRGTADDFSTQANAACVSEACGPRMVERKSRAVTSQHDQKGITAVGDDRRLLGEEPSFFARTTVDGAEGVAWCIITPRPSSAVQSGKASQLSCMLMSELRDSPRLWDGFVKAMPPRCCSSSHRSAGETYGPA